MLVQLYCMQSFIVYYCYKQLSNLLLSHYQDQIGSFLLNKITFDIKNSAKSKLQYYKAYQFDLFPSKTQNAL